jgi:hypothetical protein
MQDLMICVYHDKPVSVKGNEEDEKSPCLKDMTETGALASSIWHLTHHQQLKLSASIVRFFSRPPHLPYSFFRHSSGLAYQSVFKKRHGIEYKVLGLSFHMDFHIFFDHHPSVAPPIMPMPGYVNANILLSSVSAP